MSPLTKTAFFLSSYIPLYVIMGIKHHNLEYCLHFFFLLSLASLLLTLIFLRRAGEISPDNIKLEKVVSKDGDSIQYMIAYIFPFLNVDFSSRVDVILIIFLFVVFGFVYINTNIIHTNPILILMKYHTFEIETSNGKIAALITKQKYLKPQDDISVVPIDDYLYIEPCLQKKEKNELRRNNSIN